VTHFKRSGARDSALVARPVRKPKARVVKRRMRRGTTGRLNGFLNFSGRLQKVSASDKIHLSIRYMLHTTNALPPTPDNTVRREATHKLRPFNSHHKLQAFHLSPLPRTANRMLQALQIPGCYALGGTPCCAPIHASPHAVRTETIWTVRSRG
jgi:hypothetical protein